MLLDDVFWTYESGIMVRQRLDEVVVAFSFVKRHLPLSSIDRVIEVGTFNAGWALWSSAWLFSPVHYDLIDVLDWEDRPPVVERIESRSGFTTRFILGDSTDPRTYSDLKPADLIHIDGKHKRPQPMRDFEAYRPLWKSILMFHDLRLGSVEEAFEAASREARFAYRVDMGTRKSIGIGVLIR